MIARRAPLIVFLVAMAVYAATLAPDLTWAHFGADGGELITAAVTLGIPHPPGYPTYIILGRVLSLIPLGSVALRFNAFSALCMAAAAATTAASARQRLPRSTFAPLITGLSVAFAPLLWSQALIAEVYGLNTFVVALAIHFLLREDGRDKRRGYDSDEKVGRPLAVAPTGILLGLALTTHLSSLLIWPAALWLTSRKQRWQLLAWGVLGLAPLAALPLLAQSSSPVMWGDAATIKGWWWLVTGQLYAANWRNGSLLQIATRLPQSLNLFLKQFSYIGWLALILGVARPQTATRRRENKALLLTAALYTAYTLFYDAFDAQVFWVPATVILAPLLAQGIDWLTQSAGQLLNDSPSASLRFARISLKSLAFGLPLLSLGLNFGLVNLRTQPVVRPAAEHLLAALPADAIFVLPGDASIFSLWYFQSVEKQREDVILVDENLFAFSWYRHRLEQRYPSLEAVKDDDLSAFQNSNQQNRPFCRGTLHQSSALHCAEVSP